MRCTCESQCSLGVGACGFSVCVGERERERESVCMCVCVRERERERERESDTQSLWQGVKEYVDAVRAVLPKHDQYMAASTGFYACPKEV